MTRHARRVIVGPGDQRETRVYGDRVHRHDPYRARGSNANVPQLPAGGLDALDQLDAPVKVLAVVDRYPPVAGQNAGGEWMLHHLLRHLVRQGHEVVVTGHHKHAYEFEGVQVVHMRERAGLAPHAHVIIGHLLETNAAVELANEAGRPLVYLVHNHNQLRHWTINPATRKVTLPVFNSEWIRERYETRRDPWRWHGPSVVIRPPVLVADYKLDRDPWAQRYTTLVNATPEKGSGIVYGLAGRAPRRDYLVVEGAYGDQQHPPKSARQRVVWQPQTGEMVPDVYARTRVLVVPSHYESWGRVALEAMASGIPVVASPTPGLREALGDAALYAEPDRITEWSDALDHLDSETAYRRRSAMARLRAAEMDRVSRQDLATFEDVIRRVARLRADQVTPQAEEPAA